MFSLRLPVLALLSLISGTALAGNLTVNLSPSAAVSAGAQWRVDAGAWKNSGATVKNLSNAAHTVEYKAVSGWIAPANTTVTLTNNVTTTVTGVYGQPASVSVTLNPSAGQWQVDGGVWRNSGTVASGLTPGAHTLSYNALTNYAAPATETVTLPANQTTNLTRSYTAVSSLTVTLTPSTASWQIDGGAMRASGATVTGLTPGSHTLSFGSVVGMLPLASETITLPAAQSTSLSRSYTAEAGLIVNVTPATAQWRVDGGAWRSNGERAGQLTAGNHSVEYSAAPGYFTPSSEIVALTSGQTTTLTRSYIAEAGLIVNLTPATAQWRVDAGVWRNSGECVSQLTGGNHSIEYAVVPGYDAPGSETIALSSGQTTTLARTYTAVSSLTVNLTPSTASWRVDGGLWQNSGATLGGLSPGNHTIGYANVAGLLPLSEETVTLVATQNTSLWRSYTAEAGLIVNLTPATAQWRVDGGSWRNSGDRVGQLTAGDHAIEYGSAPGYQTPSSETVILVSGETATVSRSYTAVSSLTINLTPSSASWQVDGGAWHTSGTTVSDLTPGSHTIDYASATGMLPLPPETVTLPAAQSTSLSRSYIAEAGIVVNLTPSTAQWRVNSGPWQNSGGRVGQLTSGNHTVEYGTVAGYQAPTSSTVALVAGQTTTLSRSYTAVSSLTVNLTPATATWQVDGGTWQNSGVTIEGLTPGSHTVSYATAGGMLPLSSEIVTLVATQNTAISRSYTAEAGVIVNLTPATAQWRIDAGSWRNSGDRVGQLTAGSHSIEYSAAAGHTPLSSETLTLVAGETTTIARAYTALSSLTVTLTPSSGTWKVDGGNSRASGTTVTGLTPGNHTITYNGLSAMISPPTEVVSLPAGENTSLARAYTPAGQIFVMLYPNTAQWRVDGGAWRATHTFTGWIAAGPHTIEYSAVPNKVTPAPETVNVVASQTLQVSKTYFNESSLTINLTPAGGQWRVNGGAWRNSGERVVLATGNHAVEYSTLARYTAPVSETVALGTAEQKTLSRNYQVDPLSLTVNLSPVGQWRVDGGAWQASADVAFDLSLGGHVVDYAPVNGYIAPASETVWLRAGQSLNLTRAYGDSSSAFLEVQTVPRYLSEQGVAKWRVSGGAWNNAGVRVAVSPGTHTLEFQPVAGLDVPPPSSVTVTTGSVETIEATYYMPHRVRFFIHPDLVVGLSTADLQARLLQYAEHLQTIFHRESIRRLVFDPATDITITSTTPFSGNGTAVMPEYGFELWARVIPADMFGSGGGFGSIDISGAGGGDGLHWTQVHDPSTLAPGSAALGDYWTQIDAILHEFEHAFGAGIGEYYSASRFLDPTDVWPFNSVNYFDPADSFWNAHPDLWADPLVRYAWDNYRIGSPATLPALLESVHFSAITRGIVNGCYRMAAFNPGSRKALPDLSRVRVKVVDAVSGQPIAGSSLRIWNRPNPGASGGEERTVLPTGTPGVSEFIWTPNPNESPLNDWENGKLLKAWASGYQPKAQWEWIYDAQRVKVVDDLDVWEITIALEPAP